MRFKMAVTSIVVTLLLAGILASAFVSADLAATTNIHPETLNLKSKGRWITCHIELPEGYNASDINRATILLNNSIPVDPFWLNKPLKSVFGAYDDGRPHLKAKFNRTAVSELILSEGIKYGNVTLTITGELFDGTSFEGSDVIMSRMPGDVDSNGNVDVVDAVAVAVALGSNDPYTDLNEDEVTDICDIVTVAVNFGTSY